MPLESKAQTRAMYAAKAGHSTLGIPQSVGAEFVAAGPRSSNLPERKGRKRSAKGKSKRRRRSEYDYMDRNR